MALAQLFLQCVQLSEAVCVAPQWVAKDVAGLVENGDFVAFVQFPALVSSDQGLVDKGTVTGQVLEHRDGIAALLLREQQTMPVRDGRRI